MQAGREPIRPYPGVGQVVEDAESLATADPLVGDGQREWTQLLDPGQRVAGVDEVPQVPEPAAGKRRQPARGQRSEALAAGCDQRHGDDQGERGAR